MKVKVKVTILHTFEAEIPNYVKKDKDSIEEYLIDNYTGFECEDEGDSSFDFEGLTILKNAL